MRLRPVRLMAVLAVLFAASQLVALAAGSGCKLPTTDVAQGTPGSIDPKQVIVVQGTPGSIDPKQTVQAGVETGEVAPPRPVAQPRQWSLDLDAHSQIQTIGTDMFSVAVTWEDLTDTRSPSLMYVRFRGDGWFLPRVVGSDETGQLDPRWWTNSQLYFVYGTPGDIDPHTRPPAGTGGDSVVHDQIQSVLIDTTGSSSMETGPTHAWTVYVDCTILAIPSNPQGRRGEPRFGVTRVGTDLIPTVAWTELSDLNKQVAVARFVDGRWTLIKVPAGSVVVVEGTPGSADPENETLVVQNGMEGVGDVAVESHLQLVIIDLTGEETLSSGADGSSLAAESSKRSSESVSAFVLWRRAIGLDDVDLVLARFEGENWSLARGLSDAIVEPEPGWWKETAAHLRYSTPGDGFVHLSPQVTIDSEDSETHGRYSTPGDGLVHDRIPQVMIDPEPMEDSQLVFVLGTPGDTNPHVQGTPGDGLVHDQLPQVTIDTDESIAGETRLPARGWTIYVDSSVLVIPPSLEGDSGDPTLTVTRIGEAVVPTVTWTRSTALGTHESVAARFVNGVWTLNETETVPPTGGN